MPTLEGQGYRVRLVLGESNGQRVSESSVLLFLNTDGYASEDSTFTHNIKEDFNAWLYAVEGDLQYKIDGKWHALAQGESTTISQTDPIELNVRGTSETQSHFTLLSGETINESFVQQGPLR